MKRASQPDNLKRNPYWIEQNLALWVRIFAHLPVDRYIKPGFMVEVISQFKQVGQGPFFRVTGFSVSEDGLSGKKTVGFVVLT